MRPRLAKKNGPSRPVTVFNHAVLWAIFGITIALALTVATAGTMNSIGNWRERIFTGSLPVSPGPEYDFRAEDLRGKAAVDGRFDTARVEVSGLSADTANLLFLSSLAWTALWLIGLGALAFLVWRLLEAKPFAASLTTTVLVAGLALSGGNLSAQLHDGLALWHVASELASPRYPDGWFWSLHFPVDLTSIAFGIVLLLIGLAFRHGERLQRDTEGLV